MRKWSAFHLAVLSLAAQPVKAAAERVSRENPFNGLYYLTKRDSVAP